MPLFTSSKEKRYWFWAILVLAAIYSALLIQPPSITYNQNVQAVFFVLGLLFVGAAVVMHGLEKNPGKVELSILLGIIAVYVMLFFRLGAPERSHVIEYSVLAVFIHKALSERARHRKVPLGPAFLTLLIGLLIGSLDEGIQLFLPQRVFDAMDIIFNSLAVMLAMGSSLLISRIRKRVKK